MNAGETAFTRMPRGARSFAAAFVSPITAAFEAEYAGMFGAPETPAIEAMFTIEPPARLDHRPADGGKDGHHPEHVDLDARGVRPRAGSGRPA